jgi:diadenosine tetraphosphatase ApaH/serine/threonine PP2A family protein phosphatase
MRALILSDIHANLEALEAVLASAPPHDVVWNLGDIVGYGASPVQVLDRVQALGDVIVRGNHDRACAGLTSTDDFSEDAATAVRWTRNALPAGYIAWLAQLAHGPITPPGSEVSCVHGSPADEDEYLFGPEEALLAFQASPHRITFFGHTHVQGAFATNGDDFFRLYPRYESAHQPADDVLTLRGGIRYLINPGSVGQPRDGDWRAAFALYDDVESILRWHRVPYLVSKTQRSILKANLPEILAFRLRKGM